MEWVMVEEGKETALYLPTFPSVALADLKVVGVGKGKQMQTGQHQPWPRWLQSYHTLRLPYL